MAENSKIEWTVHTFNPWIGCQHVSPGCDHCYAETQNAFRKWSAHGAWGPHAERKRTSEGYWKKPQAWVRKARKTGARPSVFCASLADWLDNQVPKQWRVDLEHLIERTPELDWLLLTKRIENFTKLSSWARSRCPPNVWLGATTENQEYFDRRWSILARIPAVVHFISYEPALGPLTLRDAVSLPDWIICGGESGSKARMMDPAWARALRDECADRDVAFFMKQMTGKKPIPHDLLVRQTPVKRRTATKCRAVKA
jgi:protein gp37